MRTLEAVPSAQPKPGNADRRQLELNLQGAAPVPAVILAPPAGDWTRAAEPVPRQPLHGYQPELLPRSPAGHAHS